MTQSSQCLSQMQHHDKSAQLESMLSEVPEPLDLLGEMQVAFIQFMMLEDLQGFQQWKTLVLTSCLAEQLIIEEKRHEFFMDLVPVLYAQLKELPDDFLQSEQDAENGI